MEVEEVLTLPPPPACDEGIIEDAPQDSADAERSKRDLASRPAKRQAADKEEGGGGETFSEGAAGADGQLEQQQAAVAKPSVSVAVGTGCFAGCGAFIWPSSIKGKVAPASDPVPAEDTSAVAVENRLAEIDAQLPQQANKFVRGDRDPEPDAPEAQDHRSKLKHGEREREADSQKAAGCGGGGGDGCQGMGSSQTGPSPAAGEASDAPGPRTFPKEVEALAQTLFAMFDTDKSGTLSTAEVEKSLCLYGFAAEEITEVFMKADKNFDGQLSVKEFMQGVMPILCERIGFSRPAPGEAAGEAGQICKELIGQDGIQIFGENGEGSILKFSIYLVCLDEPSPPPPLELEFQENANGDGDSEDAKGARERKRRGVIVDAAVCGGVVTAAQVVKDLEKQAASKGSHLLCGLHTCKTMYLTSKEVPAGGLCMFV
jgi:hypothetical protein